MGSLADATDTNNQEKAIIKTKQAFNARRLIISQDRQSTATNVRQPLKKAGQSSVHHMFARADRVSQCTQTNWTDVKAETEHSVVDSSTASNKTIGRKSEKV